MPLLCKNTCCFHTERSNLFHFQKTGIHTTALAALWTEGGVELTLLDFKGCPDTVTKNSLSLCFTAGLLLKRAQLLAEVITKCLEAELGTRRQ